MTRLLYVYTREASFIHIDRDALAERFELEERYRPRPFDNPLDALAAVRRCDAVVGWWATWQTYWPVTFARMLGKPSLVIVGGFDVANLPDIDFGYQQGGVRRRVSRAVLKRATRLLTNSYYSQREIELNIGLPPERVPVLHHGFPDPFGELPSGERKRMALCVGVVTRGNMAIKGQRPFVEAAAQLPDVEFVLAGKWGDDAIEELRALAGPNVRFTGWVEHDALHELMRTAAVYVQPSRHEGFGMAVAEAMLGGCIPVVTGAGALPEVVGDAGVQVDSPSPGEVADGIRRGLELAEDRDARARARERVLEEFPLSRRRQGLQRAVEDLLSQGGR